MEVGPLVLGGNVFGWTADRDASFAVLDAFVEAGGRSIDSADVYSVWAEGNSGGESETILGEWFAARGRRDDVLAYFSYRASNGPTEAINGRLEALRRNALGFRNLINYRIRSLLHCGALAL